MTNARLQVIIIVGVVIQVFLLLTIAMPWSVKTGGNFEGNFDVLFIGTSLWLSLVGLVGWCFSLAATALLSRRTKSAVSAAGMVDFVAFLCFLVAALGAVGTLEDNWGTVVVSPQLGVPIALFLALAGSVLFLRTARFFPERKPKALEPVAVLEGYAATSPAQRNSGTTIHAGEGATIQVGGTRIDNVRDSAVALSGSTAIKAEQIILRELDDASNRIVAELEASPEHEIPAGIRHEALELVQAIRSEAHQPKRNKSVLLALRDRLSSVARPIASLGARLAPLWPILERLLGL